MSTLFFVIPSRLDFSCSVSANDEHDEEAEGVGDGKVLFAFRVFEHNIVP